MTFEITPHLDWMRYSGTVLALQTAFSIWRCMCRRNDLEQLSLWASRKRLAGPRQYYTRLLTDTEQQLLRYQLRRPRLTQVIRLFIGVGDIVFPAPTRYRKGSAAKYKLRNYSLNWRPSEKRVLSY